MSDMQLAREYNTDKIIQVFKIKRVVTLDIVEGVGTFVPDENDRIFFATEEVADFVATIHGVEQAGFRLPANFPISFAKGSSFTFSDNTVNTIVVM
jgi:hypothetical protein